jgi:hypothetical protein
MFKKILLGLSFLCAAMAFDDTRSLAKDYSDFYWAASYGRGGGEVPKLRCEEGRVKQNSLCYKPCPAGYNGEANWCRPHTYSRGKGTTIPTWYKTERVRKKRNCSLTHCDHYWGTEKKLVTECRPGKVQWGTECFEPCRPGYNGSGSECIHRVKAYDRGVGVVLKQYVPAGHELYGGILYRECRPGYYGVGPVCWIRPPAGYVKCGMGIAKDHKTCGMVLAGQTMAGVMLPIAVCEMAENPGCGLMDAAKNAVTSLRGGAKEAEALAEVGPKLEEAVTDLGEAVVKEGVDIVKNSKGLMELLEKESGKIVNFLIENKTTMSRVYTSLYGDYQAVNFLRAIETSNEWESKLFMLRAAADIGALVIAKKQLSMGPAAEATPFLDVISAGLAVISAYAYPVYEGR